MIAIMPYINVKLAALIASIPLNTFGAKPIKAPRDINGHNVCVNSIDPAVNTYHRLPYIHDKTSNTTKNVTVVALTAA